MRRPLLVAFAVAAGVFAAAPRARANPLDTFGFGSRGTAMGGAQAADVSDYTAGYYNPAGLARARGVEIGIGYFRADHFLKTNGNDNHVDPVKGLVGGVVVPGKLLGIPFAFGLALHLPDDRISRVRALRQEQPRWELFDNRNQRLYLAANVAVSPWPWLQLGGGLSFMSSTQGRLDITGTANILNAQQSQLRHEVDATLTAVRYPQVGARVALGKRAAVAVVYRGQFALELDLHARLFGDISQLTTAYYALESYSINAFLPQQVVVGASWEPIDHLRVNADLTWVDWSAYVAPVAQLNVALDIPPPQGGWPAGITPPSTPAATRIEPLRLHDRVIPHLGMEWQFVDSPHWQAFARGGYEYSKSPFPAQTGLTNYIDRDRHSFSLGAGVRWVHPGEVLAGDVRLDMHAQWSVLPEAITVKSDPADFVGDYSAGGHIWNVGLSTAVGF